MACRGAKVTARIANTGVCGSRVVTLPAAVDSFGITYSFTMRDAAGNVVGVAAADRGFGANAGETCFK